MHGDRVHAQRELRPRSRGWSARRRSAAALRARARVSARFRSPFSAAAGDTLGSSTVSPAATRLTAAARSRSSAFFRMYPRAPASSACRTSVSSACMLSIRTATSGDSLQNLPRGRQAVRARHRAVHHDHLRLEPPRQLNRFVAVAALRRRRRWPDRLRACGESRAARGCDRRQADGDSWWRSGISCSGVVRRFRPARTADLKVGTTSGLQRHGHAHERAALGHVQELNRSTDNARPARASRPAQATSSSIDRRSGACRLPRQGLAVILDFELEASRRIAGAPTPGWRPE